MATALDQINAKKATAVAKASANEASRLADVADANAGAALIVTLTAKGPLVVLSDDGVAVIVYSTGPDGNSIDTKTISLASQVSIDTPAPDPTPAPTVGPASAA